MKGTLKKAGWQPGPGLGLDPREAQDGRLAIALVRRAEAPPHEVIERLTLSSASDVELLRALVQLVAGFPVGGEAVGRAVQDMGGESGAPQRFGGAP